MQLDGTYILRHAVTPFEVEEVLRRPHIIFATRTVNGEDRWKLFGKTESGRYLCGIHESAEAVPYGH